MPKEIHSSKPITIAEAYELLWDREKDAVALGKELSYMQKEAMDHARFTTRSSGEDARKFVEFLTDTLKISQLGAISLANTLPNTIDEIRQILDVEGRKMDTEIIEKILSKIEKIDRLENIPEETKYIEEEYLEEKEVNPAIIPDDIKGL